MTNNSNICLLINQVSFGVEYSKCRIIMSSTMCIPVVIIFPFLLCTAVVDIISLKSSNSLCKLILAHFKCKTSILEIKDSIWALSAIWDDFRSSHCLRSSMNTSVHK